MRAASARLEGKRKTVLLQAPDQYRKDHSVGGAWSRCVLCEWLGGDRAKGCGRRKWRPTTVAGDARYSQTRPRRGAVSRPLADSRAAQGADPRGHRRLIDSSAFTNGPQVAEFEEAFAAYCGVAHCVGVASGLDALRLGAARRRHRAGRRGDRSRATPSSRRSRRSRQAGGVPVPVDVDADDYNLDPDAVAAAVEPSATRCVMPVHLYGQMADMASARRARRARTASRWSRTPARRTARARRRARGRGRRRGRLQLLSGQEPRRVRRRRRARHERRRSSRARARAARARPAARSTGTMSIGYTARLDTIQAVVLLRKLPLLDALERQRRAAAALYARRARRASATSSAACRRGQPARLAPLRRPDARAGCACRASCASAAIGIGRHYPEPPHLSARLRGARLRGAARSRSPRRSRDELLSLPIFPGITEEQIAPVVDGGRRRSSTWLTEPATRPPTG